MRFNYLLNFLMFRRTNSELEGRDVAMLMDDSSIVLNCECYANLFFADEDAINYVLLLRLIKLFYNERSYIKHGISINYVASLICTNKSYLSHLINIVFNVNFNQFINLHRVMDACCNLKTNERICIIDLGESLGFSSFSTFSNAFKKFTGYTPYRWQKRINVLKNWEGKDNEENKKLA